MVEFLLLDLDDTILDFKLAEYKALQASLREFGIEPTDAICSRCRAPGSPAAAPGRAAQQAAKASRL